jgi:hypothetical protein
MRLLFMLRSWCWRLVALSLKKFQLLGPVSPVGHRQPTVNDLPPDVVHKEVPPEKPPMQESQKDNIGRRLKACPGCAGGPPTLQVGPSCVAAGAGSVILGRNKEACLADENTARDTLKQNWSKYPATDKADCVTLDRIAAVRPVMSSSCPVSRSCGMRAASEAKTRLRATSDSHPPADPHPPACAAASASNLDIATAGAGMTATPVLYFRHEGRRQGIASHGHHPSRRGPQGCAIKEPPPESAMRKLIKLDGRAVS